MRKRLALCFSLAFASLAVAQTAPSTKVRIALVGDSTVTDKAGWGVGFAQLLKDDVELNNASRGGRSSRTFIQEGRWKAILDARPDYVLIQFGHNDQPGTDRATDLATEYPKFMRQYVSDARAAGIVPILVTPLVRREFKGGPNQITSSLASWADVVRQLAKDEHVPLVELHDRSKAICEALGRDACVALMSQPKSGGFDGTHLTTAGSMIMGAVIVDELKRAVPEFAPHFRDVPRMSETPASTIATVGGGDRPTTAPS